jgi:tetratricopeptide (TPR) repeat protein
MHYIDKSLAYFPENPYGYIKVYIQLAKDRDCERAKTTLLSYFEKDSTRVDIVQELGKLAYITRDYDEALKYYKKFVQLRDAYKLDIYKHEDIRLAYVFAKAGDKKRADEYIKSFKDFADNDRSLYKHLFLSGYYSYSGDNKKALEHLNLFSNENDFLFWVLIFDQEHRLYEFIKIPEVKTTFKKITDNFWQQHETVKAKLKEDGLI